MNLWWIRRDLRLHDNPALHAALQSGGVIPVFILDPRLLTLSRRRTSFLIANLRTLDRALRTLGSSLVVRHGDPSQILPRLVEQTGAQAVYAHADVSPFARRQESEVARHVRLQLVGWPSMVPPPAIRTGRGRGYTVYRQFYQRLSSLTLPEPLPPPARLPPHGVVSEPLPEVPPPWPPGEEAGFRRLKDFIAGPIFQYHRERDRIDLEVTSRLSPYLRFGVLSPRVAFHLARQAMDAAHNSESRKGAARWLDELLWREFFAHLLFHYPHSRREPLRQDLQEPEWDNDEQIFRTWCEGQTGYPLIDAAMRELRETGWMHNRARMVVASFLVKNLLLDWRWGEQYFFEHLLDGDPASNSGNWQWVTGIGTDRRPYLRIFNPVLQGLRFDPAGAYVRRWIPELARVPAPYVHAPWTLPRDDQIAYRCRVGRDYPRPVVDLAASRQRALDRYRAIRAAQRRPSR
ncbi:MAG: DNA photolyase family protein [Armatimonadetes bacterium]|nr:DNA photolyase family protein [Armatimonadota bacterium]MDW8152839.1 deoxyribodipyrimidine photo-lyase [Armatimonadota bacterium]